MSEVDTSYRTHLTRREATIEYERLLAEVSGEADPDSAGRRASLSSSLAFYRNPSLRDWDFHFAEADKEPEPFIGFRERMRRDSRYNDLDLSKAI